MGVDVLRGRRKQPEHVDGEALGLPVVASFFLLVALHKVGHDSVWEFGELGLFQVDLP